MLEYRTQRTAPGAPAPAQAAALNLDELIAEIAAESPALVLVDIELPGQLMALAGSGIPVAAWTDMMSLWSAPRVPPLSSAIVPGVGLAGSRLGIAAAWLRFRLWKSLRFLRLRIARKGHDELSVMRHIASHYGFPLRKEGMHFQWLIPFAFRTIPTLVFNAPEVEFPHTPRSNVAYIGPVVNLNRATGRDLDPRDRERLNRILHPPDGAAAQPIVYVAFGTWDREGDSGLMSRIIEAVSAHAGWQVIVSLGGRDTAATTPAAPNVHLFDWVDQVEVLSAASVAIHHGGINSVNECVMTATPMLIYARNRLDRAGNAARITYHRLGMVGDRDGDSPDDIARRLEQLMADSEIHSSTAKMRDRYLAYGSANTAAAAIESLIRGSASD